MGVVASISFDWFIPGGDRLAENFPLVVEHLLVPAEFRKRVLLDLMRPVNGISTGYKSLAELVMRGLIRTIFTTNFDTRLPDASENDSHTFVISMRSTGYPVISTSSTSIANVRSFGCMGVPSSTPIKTLPVKPIP